MKNFNATKVKEGSTMSLAIGDQVYDPRAQDRLGRVVRIHVNPACLMRSVEVYWEDGTGELEELEEIECGPLED